MRNDQQFEQLMLQYNQLKNGSEDIYKMIESEDYDGAITMIKARGPVFLNCKCIRKFLELTPEQETVLNEVTEELRVLEKRNIDFLKERKDKVEEELKITHKAEKIQHAYEFDKNHSGTIVNIEE